MDNKQKEQEKKRNTPIVDGDARPDMPLNPKEKKGQRGQENGNPDPDSKFESERSSDLNSMEDFKDAK